MKQGDTKVRQSGVLAWYAGETEWCFGLVLVVGYKLSHPLIQPKVNNTVDRWGKDNLKYGLSFPSRSYVRRKRRAPAHPQYKSKIHVQFLNAKSLWHFCI